MRPEEAEAETCLKGVRLMVEWMEKQTCVESDCSNLIRALEKKIEDRSRWVGILIEIQAAECLLPACNFRHTHREANR
jgi:hypothetical protein